MPYIYLSALYLLPYLGYTQKNTTSMLETTLSFEEYLGYVKKYHPLMKQAEITLNIGEANLLKARGAFDPKIEIDYDRKKFKNIEYYDQFNATFKIPTWYGIEFKANFEENTGEFLNPNLSVPDGGLYSAGISFSLAQGFFINERMAALRKAKFFKKQTKAERDVLVNHILYKASKAYFDWLQNDIEVSIYNTYLENAANRLKAIERSVETGDKAAIEITEARITMQNRKLMLEAAILKKRKSILLLSNFLWINSTPIEIRNNVTPIKPEKQTLESILFIEKVTDLSLLLENHPKLQSMDAKIDGLYVERSIKRNKILPKIDLQYNFLNTEIDQISGFDTANYKAFVNFSFPLFLRKERGDVQLANLKLEQIKFERQSTSLQIQNKIEAINAEINSLSNQNTLIADIVIDYKTLVAAEERKFSLGESSLFLINSREQKLIDAQLKENSLMVKELKATAKLYNALGITKSELPN